jgi:hypothetical protein
LAWALPSLATFVFLHIGKPGYLMPLVPLACLYAAAGLGSNGRRGAVLLAGIALVNTVQFLTLAPLTGASVGEGLKYASKSVWQRRLTDLAPIAFATRATMRQEDRRLEAVVREVQRACPGGGVVLVSPGGEIDWRRAMFYLPGDSVVRLDEGRGPLAVASRQRLRFEDARLPLLSPCDPLWIASESVVRNATILPSEVPIEALQPGLWQIRGTASITVESGTQVAVGRRSP